MASPINIVMASDNRYAILMGVSIKSIELNHKGPEKIHFYLINDHITPENRKKVEQCVTSDKLVIHWLNIGDIISPEIQFPAENSAFPVTAYLRLLAAYIVPKDASKLIYLDVDTIVRTDISILWHTDIEGHVIGAVQDICKTVGCEWAGIPNYRELGLDGTAKYFNSGVMIIDVERWKQEDLTNRVFKDLNNNIEHINFADQYGLNVTLYKQWFEIDPRWNCYSVFTMPDPFLIHFLDIKPIFKSYRGNKAYGLLFQEYLEATPWKGFKLKGHYVRLFHKAQTKIKKLIKRYRKR